MKWIKVSERLPDKTDCYFVRWVDDGHVVIKNACMWNFITAPGMFDVSDDDDPDPANPRSTQPDEWLDESESLAGVREAVGLLNWMVENGVEISHDDKGRMYFDLGLNNYTAEQLYQKYLES